MAILYEDAYLTLDDDGITVRHDYFPRGDKHIPYAAIRAVDERPMGTWTGKLRIWGSGDFRHWYHLEPHRPSKDKALVLHTGPWVRPVLTPDDPDRVLAIVRGKVGE